MPVLYFWAVIYFKTKINDTMGTCLRWLRVIITRCLYLLSRQPNPRSKNSLSPPMTFMTSQSLPQDLLVALWLWVRALIWLASPERKFLDFSSFLFWLETLIKMTNVKHLFAVVCANVCSIQISLGSTSSFMRVYIYCWDNREYSWYVFLFENFVCKYSSLKQPEHERYPCLRENFAGTF